MDKKLAKQKIKEIILKYKEYNKDNHFKILSEIAYFRNGRIKEGEVYINNITKITFIDKLGNEFQSSPANIKEGAWSPYENGKVRNSDYHMAELNRIALSKGGKIKDGEKYITQHIKIIFLDKLGNEFTMSPKAVKKGQWSPYESGSVYNDPNYHMKEINKIVLSKGGKIKDGEQYISSSTKMTFIDKLGNEFKMIPSCVKNGQWSPYESDNVRDPNYHIKELQKIALSKGGKIKDNEKYVNNRTKMTFIDQLGNEFKTTPHEVKSGKWSPFERNYFENVCRQIIEQIYGCKFPSVWNILKRNNGNRLQLDGYADELKIAFEYQGIQHSVGWWNKPSESLADIIERDKEKKQICKDKGIILLEIHYYKNIKNIQHLVKQTIYDINKSYQMNNKEIPIFISNLKIEEINIDLSKISHVVLMQKELERIALSKGGQIKKGEIYISNSTKMAFIDKLGNEFKMTPNHVKRGVWSPYESKYSATKLKYLNFKD